MIDQAAVDAKEIPLPDIYLIPGIGLSQDYFSSLRFPSGCRITSLRLMQPLGTETLQHYAGRLAQQLEEGRSFLLIGMSFGGILAQEIARVRKPVMIILLSSIRGPGQLPWYFRAGYNAGFARILPYSLIGGIINLLRIAGGRKNQYLYDGSTVSAGYLSWCLPKIMTWQPPTDSTPCVQIHGSKDRLLPCRYTDETYVVPGASHLLLPAKKTEVNAIINSIILKWRGPS